MSNTHAVLLVNLGSPNSTSLPDVRAYLKQFLMDKYVIDLPWLLRAMLIYGIILPFRPKKTAAAYNEIWTKSGSPLIITSQSQQRLLQEQVFYPVELAMRYGTPSIPDTISSLIMKNPLLKSIHVIPLYPHYAMSSTKTVEEEVKRVVKQMRNTIRLYFQPPFYNDPGYIEIMKNSIRSHLSSFDYLLFSYHGIPYRHLRKTDPTKHHCLSKNCCSRPSKAWDTCYQHQTVDSTHRIAESLGLSQSQYGIAYQSRLGRDPWLLPNTEDEIKRLASQGVKRLGVVCPSFVSDCLETLEEIKMEAREIFEENGGKSFTYIDCLNITPSWINLMKKWIESVSLPV